MIKLKTLVSLYLVGAAIVFNGIAAEFFVSPSGKSSNNGSINAPWDISTALGHPSALKPGDTIWVRGGVYGTGKDFTYRSSISGTRDKPIVFRNYNNERVTINGGLRVSGGQYTWFWGLEITNFDTKRVSFISGFWKDDVLRQSGAVVHASGTKIINCIVHDTRSGLELWAEATDGELYGNLIFNNGWLAADSISTGNTTGGDGVYSQNKSTQKTIAENIIFGNLGGYGLQIYGSDAAFIIDYTVQGNVNFQNDLLIGGGSPASKVKFVENMTYGRGGVRLGYEYGSQANNDILLQGNYIYSYNNTHHSISLNWWKNVTMLDNNVYCESDGNSVRFILAAGATPVGQIIDRNTYYKGSFSLRDINNKVLASSFSGWQSLGFDKNGKSVASVPSDIVIVRKNAYDSGRGHVIVYNFSKKSSVGVNLSGLLSNGNEFEIRDAQNYYGNPVAKGTYNGGTVSIALNQSTKAPYYGDLSQGTIPDFMIGHTSSEFNVFVVTKTGGGTQLPPPAQEIRVVSYGANFNLCGNPLDNGVNTIQSLFGTNAPAGTLIYKFNELAPKGSDVSSFEFGKWSKPDIKILPGDGFYLANFSKTPFSIQFTGFVSTNEPVFNRPGFSKMASVRAKAGKISQLFNYVPKNGDIIYKYKNSTFTTFIYEFGEWIPSEPTLEVGEGVFFRLVK